MIGHQRKPQINWKILIQNINQEEVFYSLLGYFPDLRKRYKSPFRHDTTAGCRFEWKDGLLCFVDNARYKNKLYWSIFDVMKEIHGLNFPQAIERIANGRFDGTSSKPVYKDRIQIRFSTIPWKKENLFFLDPQILNQNNVYLVSDYWIFLDGKWRKNWVHKNTLCIAYYFPKTDHVKLYFPEKEEMRFYSNCTNQDIYGYSNLADFGDVLYISKSQKDRLTLKYHFGCSNVIALQNEGCYIPDEIIQDLKSRFKKIIIIFDNDYTGYEQARKLSTLYDIEYKIIECSYKDPYEMYLHNFNGYFNFFN